jgi:tRNA(Ile)-lysidine synthase
MKDMVAADPSLEALVEAGCAPLDPPGALWLVALSGGPDSSALLLALLPVARRHGISLAAAHVDHATDPGSAGRAERALAIAALLGVECALLRRPVAERRRRGESPEAAARRVRYEALEEQRAALGATRILTAHHRDDQAETLLLRMAARTGVAGLAGIAARRGKVWRPALGCGRAALRARLALLPLPPAQDPSNEDSGVPRSRLRAAVLPRLAEENPGLVEALAALAARAASAVPVLRSRISELTGLDRDEGGLERLRLERLPTPLRPLALAQLFRQAGADPPPGERRLGPLLRSLERGEQLRRRFGSFEVIERRGRVRVVAAAGAAAPFSYSVSIPGETELPELGLRLRIRPAAPGPWLERGDPRSAALALGDRNGAPAAREARIRSRRPGDRLRPLGGPGTRKLKDLLIDRAVPREARDRLPLLEIDGRIAWVPGVTIDDRFRWRGEPRVWRAELSELGGNAPCRGPVEATERETE